MINVLGIIGFEIPIANNEFQHSVDMKFQSSVCACSSSSGIHNDMSALCNNCEFDILICHLVSILLYFIVISFINETDDVYIEERVSHCTI